MIRLRSLAAVVVLTVPMVAQEAMITDSLDSPSLGMVRRFGVLLPADHDPRRAYPVLYLLHGHDGSYRDWYDRTSVAAAVRTLPMIVVLPDGDNSWYVNSWSDRSKRYEDYVVDDLRRAVESRYVVDTTRRAIAGLSMGGYGALLIAFKHPALFRFAGSLSGAFALPSFIDDTVRQPRGASLTRTLRQALGAESGPQRASNDVYVLVHDADTASAPYVYLATGIKDGFPGFLSAHRDLADSLRVRGLRYEYHETPGTHSWKYWGREIRPLIDRMCEILGIQPE